jgi:hypothetical protein
VIARVRLRIVRSYDVVQTDTDEAIGPVLASLAERVKRHGRPSGCASPIGC